MYRERTFDTGEIKLNYTEGEAVEAFCAQVARCTQVQIKGTGHPMIWAKAAEIAVEFRKFMASLK
jgi:hypothetical protein